MLFFIKKKLLTFIIFLYYFGVVGIIKYEEGLMSVLKNQLKLINENC